MESKYLTTCKVKVCIILNKMQRIRVAPSTSTIDKLGVILLFIKGNDNTM